MVESETQILRTKINENQKIQKGIDRKEIDERRKKLKSKLQGRQGVMESVGTEGEELKKSS